MLLAGSVAVASNRVGDAFGVRLLDDVSLILIFGSALFVAMAVVYSALVNLRRRESSSGATAE